MSINNKANHTVFRRLNKYLIIIRCRCIEIKFISQVILKHNRLLKLEKIKKYCLAEIMCSMEHIRTGRQGLGNFRGAFQDIGKGLTQGIHLQLFLQFRKNRLK